MLEQIKAMLESHGKRVYLTGDVPNTPQTPYLLVYSLQPVVIRSMARPEQARRFRFGVTCVDLSSQHIEGDADEVEAILEGSRALGALSRIEMVARGPTTRDSDVTISGVEYHTLPVHFTTTIPRGSA